MSDCSDGFERSAAGACEDIDECLGGPCGDNQACANSEGSFSCDCAENFRAGADGSCVADRCDNFPDLCSADKECVGFLGMYACSDKCEAGYKRSGPSCKDIDECIDRPCKVNEDCTNTEGSYECAVRDEPDDGLNLPAESCQSDSCTGANEVCNADNGKISCDCDVGFQKLDGACVASICTNFPGLCGAGDECVSGVCVAGCGAGYARNAAGDCEDVDECLDSPCAGQANQACVNSEGSFACECVSGFYPIVVESGAFLCEDVNECLNNPCAESEDCVNSEGGYECLPEEGPDDLGVVAPIAPLAPSEPANFVCASSCWTRACDHCSSKTTCGISYDLENNPLTIRSQGLKAKTFLKVVMYGEESKLLGTISFNSRGVFLWGCIACRQLKFRPKITKEPQIWVLKKNGNNIKITLNGRTIFKDEFTGKCSSLYGVGVTKIAFQKTAFAEIAAIPSMVPDADFNPDACQNAVEKRFRK